MAKTNPGNFFEDFEVGAELVHAVPRTITEGEAALYIGLTGSRYPLHCSAEFARSLGHPRETINDMLMFHIVFGKTVNDVSLNAVANLGYAGVEVLGAGLPGRHDALHLQGDRQEGEQQRQDRRRLGQDGRHQSAR